MLRCSNGCLYTGITTDVKKTPEDPQRRKGIRVCPSSPPSQAGLIHVIGKQIISLPSGILRESSEPGTEDRSRKEVEGSLLITAGSSILY